MPVASGPATVRRYCSVSWRRLQPGLKLPRLPSHPGARDRPQWSPGARRTCECQRRAPGRHRARGLPCDRVPPFLAQERTPRTHRSAPRPSTQVRRAGRRGSRHQCAGPRAGRAAEPPSAAGMETAVRRCVPTGGRRRERWRSACGQGAAVGGRSVEDRPLFDTNNRKNDESVTRSHRARPNGPGGARAGTFRQPAA